MVLVLMTLSATSATLMRVMMTATKWAMTYLGTARRWDGISR
jgi:hypothetical protein